MRFLKEPKILFLPLNAFFTIEGLDEIFQDEANVLIIDLDKVRQSYLTFSDYPSQNQNYYVNVLVTK